MTSFLKVYRILNLLSVDVAIGAVCCALFFAKLFQVSILPAGLISLALTVWIIYTVDHLLDARKIRTNAATKRHQFHQQHFKALVIALILISIVNGLCTFFIRERVLLGGLLLGLGVLLYLIVVRYVKSLKELLIASMYTIGVLLPSLAQSPLDKVAFPWVVMVQFGLLTLLNLLLFSWFDYENDLHDATSSFVTVFGKRLTQVCIVSLFLLMCCLMPFSKALLASCFVLGMGLIHMLLLVKHTYFKSEEQFRLIGDALFFLPIVYWWI